MQCFRSGHFRSKSKGLRGPKATLTNKINGSCTLFATIVRNKNNGQIQVTANLDYVDHDSLLKRVPLDKKEKEEIAGLLLDDRQSEWIIRKKRD